MRSKKCMKNNNSNIYVCDLRYPTTLTSRCIGVQQNNPKVGVEIRRVTEQQTKPR